MKKKPLKPIAFFKSFEEQRIHGMLRFIEMTRDERLGEMYRLNKKIYGASYGVVSKNSQLYTAKTGETIADFYKRINSQENK